MINNLVVQKCKIPDKNSSFKSEFLCILLIIIKKNILSKSNIIITFVLSIFNQKKLIINITCEYKLLKNF